MLRLQPSEICLTPRELIDLDLRLHLRRRQATEQNKSVPNLSSRYKSTIASVPRIRRGPERSRNESLTDSSSETCLPSAASNESDASFDASDESFGILDGPDAEPFHENRDSQLHRDADDGDCGTTLTESLESTLQQADVDLVSNSTFNADAKDATCKVNSNIFSEMVRTSLPPFEVELESSIFETDPFDELICNTKKPMFDLDEIRSKPRPFTRSNSRFHGDMTSEEQTDPSTMLELLYHGTSPLDELAQRAVAWTADLPFRPSRKRRSTVRRVSVGETDMTPLQIHVGSSRTVTRTITEREKGASYEQRNEHSLGPPSTSHQEAEDRDDNGNNDVYRNAATIPPTLNHIERVRLSGGHRTPSDFAIARGGRPVFGIALRRGIITQRRRRRSRTEQENGDDLEMLVSERQAWLERNEWNRGGGLERTPPAGGRFDRFL